MKKYGIDNVRGGSFCQFKLTNENRKTIERMINGSTDKCYKCGEKGHFAKECYESDDDDDDNELAWSCNYCEKEFTSKNGAQYHENFYCKVKKKLKYENYSNENHNWSCDYCGKEFDSKKGATFHENVHCKKRKKMKKDMLSCGNEELDEGVYNIDGEHLYWNGNEWYEESANAVGHRDGTIGIYSSEMNGWSGEWRPKKKKSNYYSNKKKKSNYYSNKK